MHRRNEKWVPPRVYLEFPRDLWSFHSFFETLNRFWSSDPPRKLCRFEEEPAQARRQAGKTQKLFSSMLLFASKNFSHLEPKMCSVHPITKTEEGREEKNVSPASSAKFDWDERFSASSPCRAAHGECKYPESAERNFSIVTWLRAALFRAQSFSLFTFSNSSEVFLSLSRWSALSRGKTTPVRHGMTEPKPHRLGSSCKSLSTLQILVLLSLNWICSLADERRLELRWKSQLYGREGNVSSTTNARLALITPTRIYLFRNLSFSLSFSYTTD